MQQGQQYRKIEEERPDTRSRRAFMKSAAAITVAQRLLARTAASEAAVRSGAAAQPLFAPAGELGLRIRMTQDRLTRSGVPSFSAPFVLADVSLDASYLRRFSNYSGDLSGRYIGALALLPPVEGTARLDDVVRRALGFQRADGRFGDATLTFAPQEIDREHMALLWGNGRLLVGLLEYNAAHRNAELFAAARRLAEFLLGVQENCSRPDVMQRLVGQGASGFICFTQLIEAFALLGLQAREPRYLDAAARIIPLLQPRGNQHSHGYLTTLRGILLLHQATGDVEQLRYVENAYHDLVSSPDYTVYGGVLEYFGTGPRSSGADERGRDEGCSEADFLRLSLHLWRATGKPEYLERAERCLLNEFFFNQFNTGDFGHHTGYRYGYRATESVGRAWWCCTMHGLRAFRDVLDSVITAGNDLIKINLFLDGTVSTDSLSVDLEEAASSDPAKPPGLRITARGNSAGDVSVAVRQSGWASGFSLRLNGREATGRSEGGYAVVRRKWKKGDTLEAQTPYGLRFLSRSGQTLDPAGLDPMEAAVFCGPYLLAADSGREPDFFGEPWMGNSPGEGNVVLVGRSVNPRRQSARPGSPLARPLAYRGFEYIHGGWPDRHLVTLRPISEQTMSEPQAVAVWFHCRRA